MRLEKKNLKRSLGISALESTTTVIYFVIEQPGVSFLYFITAENA